MSTLKQINANRLNSEMSTGPNTKVGKAIVSRNAIKHGLLATNVLLPCEEGKDFEELGRNLRSELQPKGELEIILVHRIVSLIWRLRRVEQIETAIFVWQQYETDSLRAKAEIESYVDEGVEFNPFSPPKITNKKRHKEAKKKLEEAHSLRDGEGPTVGYNYILQADRLDVLNRYETHLERSLFKTLHRLEHIQKTRQGVNALPPADICGDGANSIFSKQTHLLTSNHP